MSELWDGPRFFDRDGRRIDMLTFSARLMELKYKRVAETVVGGATVSTVWLGLDYSFGSGPPMIFETMIFAGHDSPLDQWCERYATEAQAVAGHAEAVTLARHELELTTTTTEEDRDG